MWGNLWTIKGITHEAQKHTQMGIVGVFGVRVSGKPKLSYKGRVH